MKPSRQIKDSETITYQPDMLKNERYGFIKQVGSFYRLTPNQIDDIIRIYKKTGGENNAVLFRKIFWENVILGITNYVVQNNNNNNNFSIMRYVQNLYSSENIKKHQIQVYRVSNILPEILENESIYMN